MKEIFLEEFERNWNIKGPQNSNTYFGHIIWKNRHYLFQHMLLINKWKIDSTQNEGKKRAGMTKIHGKDLTNDMAKHH